MGVRACCTGAGAATGAGALCTCVVSVIAFVCCGAAWMSTNSGGGTTGLTSSSFGGGGGGFSASLGFCFCIYPGHKHVPPDGRTRRPAFAGVAVHFKKSREPQIAPIF